MDTITVEAFETLDRSVTEVNTDPEAYIEVEVTRKEAVDVDDALSSLLKEAIDGEYGNAEQVSDFKRLWQGRCRGSPTIMITSSEEADIALDALDRFEAEEVDLTDRIHDDLVEVINETGVDL
ncbi:hypothetical protein [Halorubrum sp. AJ67]|uniref:hypothetical protein n=1 Tax=Halorubrum sp. AJ67 TaxID=1173487 RepID=UPI0003DC201D|nr:hypothetical protein [Halorubrum sp. AJ67]CDK38048.1 hypothetical protein BN903_248 [Halorubrum sp. AJ67]